jgi:hypothetical protein
MKNTFMKVPRERQAVNVRSVRALSTASLRPRRRDARLASAGHRDSISLAFERRARSQARERPRLHEYLQPLAAECAFPS